MNHWLRVMRPLLWWVLLVLVLLAYRKHEEWSARTFLRFGVTLQGQRAGGASVTLDGQPFDIGSIASVGRHRLEVLHPKAVSFSTNIFLWYGEHDLGNIPLKRTEGLLTLQVVPPASTVKVVGPEWQQELTNSAGLAISVPTDNYTVVADYGHFSVEKGVEVVSGLGASCRIAPEVGALAITSAQVGTTYELFQMEGATTGERLVKRGDLPATLPLLQTGKYRLAARYKEFGRGGPVTIVQDQTNTLEVKFSFGTVVLESTPAGATVRDGSGKERGMTPLTLTGILVGRWRGQVEKAGYFPASIELTVEANKTATVATNLVNRSYANAMATARRALEGSSPDFNSAVSALTEALQHEPGNATAEGMLRRARVGQALQLAQSKAREGDYTGALQQTETVLSIEPEHAEAKSLQSQCRQKMQEQQTKDAEARRQTAVAQRELHPREYFTELMKKTLNSNLFDQQEMKVKGEWADIEEKLIRAMTNEPAGFKLVSQQQPDAETFFIRAA